jgi:hypothetical protein
MFPQQQLLGKRCTMRKKGALLEHLQEFAKIYNLLGKSYVLPTSKKLCKLKKEFISNSLT